jgi:hypothetical protein
MAAMIKQWWTFSLTCLHQPCHRQFPLYRSTRVWSVTSALAYDLGFMRRNFCFLYALPNKMMRRQLHPNVRIWSSSLYPRSGDAPSTIEGVWSCLPGGSPGIQPVIVLVGVVASLALPIYDYHFWPWFLLWCDGLLGPWHDVSVCLVQWFLVWQTLPASSEGGTRRAAHRWLVLVLVVFARWSKNLFVICFTFRALCTIFEGYH